jgi:hypothetical protein
LIGSPFDVWEVIQAWQDLGEDTEAVQEQLSLSARQLKLALAYYGEFAEQIDADLALARRTLGELQSAYPFIEVLRIED